MKKVFYAAWLILLSGLQCSTYAQGNTPMETTEKKFITHADECLDIIDQAAREMSVIGVAVVAYIPGDSTESWISKMKVIGTLADGSANFLAIAYSKAAEMAETYKISGTAGRDPMLGEFSFQGGVIRKIDSGYLLAVFSGATGEQDAELAGKGMDWLLKAMPE